VINSLLLMMIETTYKVRTPVLPPRSPVRATMQVLDETENKMHKRIEVEVHYKDVVTDG